MNLLDKWFSTRWGVPITLLIIFLITCLLGD
jgi:hypothetical protein